MTTARFGTLTFIAAGCVALLFAGTHSAGYVFDFDTGMEANAAADATPNEPVYTFHLSSDESMYFGCSRRPGIFLRDVSTGEELARFDYESQTLSTFDVSGDNRLLVAAYLNLDVVAWNGANREYESRRLTRLVQPARCCSLSDDSRLAAFGCLGGWVEVVEISTGRRVAHISHGAADVSCVKFVPGAGELIVADKDGCIKRYRTAGGRLLSEYVAHTNEVRMIDFCADGSRFVSGSHDGTARLWDLGGSKPVWTIRVPGMRVLTAALSSDGRRVALAGCEAGSVVVCDVASRRVFDTGQGQFSSVNHVRFSATSPDKLFYVTLSTHSGVHRLNVEGIDRVQ